MNRLIVTACLLIVPITVFAQQGTVLYDETVRLEIELPPEVEIQMRDQIPTSTSARKALYFSETTSLMMNAPEADDEDGSVTMGGDGMMIRMMGPGSMDNRVFTDLENGKVIEKRDFLGRTFLIDGEQETYAWKLTGEQSEFLGYMCMKAVAEVDSSTVEAWFTPEIPVSVGPDRYGGLPGLILVMTIDEGERTYTATEVTLDPPAEDLLTAPDEGRKVTREEFDAIVEEKMEEMGADRRGRGGGQVMIRIGN